MPIITVLTNEKTATIEVESGANLRESLLESGLSPYTILTQSVNCGGRGICATCGVWIEIGEPSPNHWHDKLASQFGYPRLSCQVTVTTDITIKILDDKIIWGRRQSERAGKLQP